MVAHDPGYCPYCGGELDVEHIDAADRKYCPACDRIVWRNPVPVAYTAVVGEGEVLLILHDRAGQWDVPGGHPEEGEQPRVAAARELEEETGLAADPGDLDPFEVVTRAHPNGVQLWSTYFAARRDDTDGSVRADTDALEAEWFAPADLKSREDELLPYVREVGLDAIGRHG